MGSSLGGLLTAVVVLCAAGCGDDGGDAAGSGRPELRVSAAASLTQALTACSRDYDAAKVRLSFAGSDELAAQIRQGAAIDVFAAANAKLPEQLFDEGHLERPVVFATNELVLAVPADDDARVGSLEDLAADGVKLAVGAESVPVGSYTRDVLARLPAGLGDAILANVRSNEPDVNGIVGKLTQGAVDAGFVYATDVKAASGKLRAIALPAELEPSVAYGAAVVKRAREPEAAARFLAGLRSGGCADALRAAGFGPPAR